MSGHYERYNTPALETLPATLKNKQTNIKPSQKSQEVYFILD